MKKNILLLVFACLLGLGAYTLYNSGSKSTLSSNPNTQFSIEDTASVTKIFISDKVAGSVTLTRNQENGYWIVTDTIELKIEA